MNRYPLDPAEWVGGVVPCCANCIHCHEEMFFGNGCKGPELQLGRTDADDLCEQHAPIHGVTIKHVDEDRITAECLAFLEQEEAN